MENAPAKVNLTLRVLGRRPDGYHNLESLVAFADFGDRLSFVQGGELSLTVRGPNAVLAGEGADNLVLKAATALAAGITRRSTIEENPRISRSIGQGVWRDEQRAKYHGLGTAIVRPVSMSRPRLSISLMERNTLTSRSCGAPTDCLRMFSVRSPSR